MNRRVHWSILAAGGVVLLALALVGDGRLLGQGADAEAISVAGADSYVYLLEAGGESMGEYFECSGLGSRHEVEEQTIYAGAGSAVVQTRPGALQWPRIVLKGSAPGDIPVWQWRKTMESAGLPSAARDGRITMYQAGSTQPLAQWTFSQGWPASLISEGGQEELVIVHSGLALVGTTGGGGTATRR